MNMNKARRKTLEEIHSKLSDLRDLLEEVKSDEEEAFANIPESLQGSERYEISESAIENMDSALSSLEEALDSIESAAE